MFTSDEGEGWQQLGEALMPNSPTEASAMVEGLQQIGEQSLHSLLGGTSMPELHNAIALMYGPETTGTSGLPDLELFDSNQAQAFAQAAPVDQSIQMQIQAPAGAIETLQAPTLDELSSISQSPSQSPISESYFEPGQNLDTGRALNDGSSGLSDGSSGLSDGSSISDAGSATMDIGKAAGDLLGRMSEMLGSLSQGPMGFLGGLINFLLTIFSEMLSSIGRLIEESARAAASMAAELWKKHLELST